MDVAIMDDAAITAATATSTSSADVYYGTRCTELQNDINKEELHDTTMM